MAQCTPDLEYVKQTVEAAMADACRILTHTVAQADDGQMIEGTPSIGAEIACRWVAASNSYDARGSLKVATDTWQVVLPAGTAVTRFDRIRLTKRWGKALDALLEGDVDGDPVQGFGCLKVMLKNVVPVTYEVIDAQAEGQVAITGEGQGGVV